jgi:hypothetical protein
MNLWRARISLLSVFMFSWIANSLILLHFRNVMESGQRDQLFAILAKIHSVPIGVLAGGIFAEISPKKKSASAGIVWTALSLSIAWVILLAESWVSYPSSDFVAANLIDELTRRSSEVSFLIAAVLAYFSAKAT